MSPSSALDRCHELRRLVGEERKILVEFVVRLADFNRVKGWAELGYRSPWEFLRRELGLSEALASYRLTAADLVTRFPQIIAPLREGRLCVTNLIKLRDVLTEANCEEVLAQACGKPRREVEVIAAVYHPQPPAKEMLRRLPAPKPIELKLPAETVRVERPPTRRDVVKPLAPELHRLQVTVSNEFVEDLEQAKAVLSHKLPGADLAAVLHEGLRLILKAHRKRKALATKPRPAKAPAKPRSAGDRYIAAHVRRQVWTRDEGRCQEPLASGGVCGSTMQIEFHHLHEHARGGPASAANLSLRCKVHNLRAAERSYGATFMQKFRTPAQDQPLDPSEPPDGGVPAPGP
jgi:5-methylcytosine-specific restriction endonuclease McrA